MASRSDDVETLEALNRGYLLAAEKSDVAWYTEHLAEDYRATNPTAPSWTRRASWPASDGLILSRASAPPMFASSAWATWP